MKTTLNTTLPPILKYKTTVHFLVSKKITTFSVFLRYCYQLVFCWVFFSHGALHAQAYEGLQHLQDVSVQTYYSPRAEAKAKRMAKQLDSVMHFYGETLSFTPSVTLLVLTPEDWKKHTSFPVYGMPHYTDTKTLIVAAENNDFWRSFIPPLEALPKEAVQAIQMAYAETNGDLSMEPFFNLLAIHELGHAYHLQGGLNMQRKWMGELFANLFLHHYIAEKEPQLLPALTTFPNMVVATTVPSTLKYSSLEDLERYYDEIGKKFPKNYGWYQCRWHVAAGKIYDSSKKNGFKNLWQTLKRQQEPLDDRAFVQLLQQKVHPSVADVPLSWDKTN